MEYGFRPEDLRVLKYEQMRNLVALVLAAASFTAVWLGKGAGARDGPESRVRNAQRSLFAVSGDTRELPGAFPLAPSSSMAVDSAPLE